MMTEITLQEGEQLARRSGLALTSCSACGQPTLWQPSRQVPKPPRTCGRLDCGRKAGEPWAKAVK